MDSLEREESPLLISADKVKGTDVYNASNENLGSVEDIMIDKRSGKVAYAVMSFGGFLGIGEKYHPLPWAMLQYDPDQDGYRVSLSREQLERAPAYGRNETVNYTDDTWNRRVHSYYDLPYGIL